MYKLKITSEVINLEMGAIIVETKQAQELFKAGDIMRACWALASVYQRCENLREGMGAYDCDPPQKGQQ